MLTGAHEHKRYLGIIKNALTDGKFSVELEATHRCETVHRSNLSLMYVLFPFHVMHVS
jgi:hypothetical protein